MTVLKPFRSRLIVRVGAMSLALLACKHAKQVSAPNTPVAALAPTTEVAKAPERVYPEPPTPGQPKPVNFPEIQEFRLANGLDVYLVENHEVPVVSVQLVVKAGTMDERYLADFTAAMLAEGTKSRPKAAIDDAIEQVGGELASNAGVHTSQIDVRTLRRDLELGLGLLADEAMNPAFPDAALEKLKKQAKTALDLAKSQPAELAETLFGMVAYPDGHPYGRPFAKPEEIDAIRVDSLKAFHAQFYRPNNAFLILSGDITRQDAQPVVEKALGKWAHIDEKSIPPNPLNKFTRYTLPEGLVFHIVDRPASAQSEIIVGNLAIARNHPEWIKLEVSNSILGGGASGRLFTDIREVRGLTYGIYSSLSDGQAPGTFKIATRTKTKQTEDMIKGIFEHIEKIRTTDPSDKEFETVVRKLVGSFPLQIETASDIAAKVSKVLTYNLPRDYWKNYRDSVLQVKRSDVKQVASKYVHAVPHVVIIGKADKIEKPLRKAYPEAKIVKYDTDLKRIEG